MSIEVQNLTKTFDDLVAVDHLNLSVPPGEIYGLIGPNGAGKTTALRMMAGLMIPTEGTAFVCGQNIVESPLKAKYQIGFLTGSTGLYGRLTVKELLTYFGKLYGLSQKEVNKQIEDLAERLHFDTLLDRRCDRLSTGEKQRVSLARSVIHKPKVVIFDEPTAGLDVLASRFVADFIRQAKQNGRAIIFSTHYMTEAELLCDRIGLLYRGALMMEGTPSDIKEKTGASSLETAFLTLVDQRDNVQ